MSLMDEDDKPKRKVAHEVGCDLSSLSADELSLRIELLKSEISRLEAERQKKSAGRAAAESLFKI